MQLARKTVPLLATLAALGLAAALPQAAQAQTNLITNGSFEQGSFASNAGGGGESLGVGSTAISGWTVTSAELAWLPNTNTFGLSTPTGTYFLDLTGYHDSLPYGGVTQTIATTNGANYTLMFSLGVNTANGIYSGPAMVTASAGNTSQSFTYNPVGGSGNQWGLAGFTFTAAGASTPITITGTGAGGGQFLGLDNVSVLAAAPEPSQTAALGLGLLGLTGLALRARKRRAA